MFSSGMQDQNWQVLDVFFYFLFFFLFRPVCVNVNQVSALTLYLNATATPTLKCLSIIMQTSVFNSQSPLTLTVRFVLFKNELIFH